MAKWGQQQNPTPLILFFRGGSIDQLCNLLSQLEKNKSANPLLIFETRSIGRDFQKTELKNFVIFSTSFLNVGHRSNRSWPTKLPTPSDYAREILIAKEKLQYTPDPIFPKTFNEHILNRKLINEPAGAALLADKLEARSFVSKCTRNTKLTKVFQVLKRPDDLDYKSLPNTFALKSNHANAQVLIVHDKYLYSYQQLRSVAAKWLSSVYGRNSNESWYSQITPKIYAEEVISPRKGVRPAELKVHVFNGKARLLQFLQRTEGSELKEVYLTHRWLPLPFVMQNQRLAIRPDRPTYLSNLLADAERIAQRLNYVRIDFYLLEAQYFFGEVTFAHLAGWGRFIRSKQRDSPIQSYKLDLRIGRFWRSAFNGVGNRHDAN